MKKLFEKLNSYLLLLKIKDNGDLWTGGWWTDDVERHKPYPFYFCLLSYFPAYCWWWFDELTTMYEFYTWVIPVLIYEGLRLLWDNFRWSRPIYPFFDNIWEFFEDLYIDHLFPMHLKHIVRPRTVKRSKVSQFMVNGIKIDQPVVSFKKKQSNYTLPNFSHLWTLTISQSENTWSTWYKVFKAYLYNIKNWKIIQLVTKNSTSTSNFVFYFKNT